MKEGIYTIYQVQYKITHMSEYNKPNGPLKPYVDSNGIYDNWGYASQDHFYKAMNPHIGDGNNWCPKYKKSDKELTSVFLTVGEVGWYSLKFAIRALLALRKLDALGEFDDVDYTSKKKTTAVRHEFRLVKITKSFKIEEVNMDDVIALVK